MLACASKGRYGHVSARSAPAEADPFETLSRSPPMAQQQPQIDVPAASATSFGPKVPPQGDLVGEGKGGGFWVTEGGYQCAFVACENRAGAIHAPPTLCG